MPEPRRHPRERLVEGSDWFDPDAVFDLEDLSTPDLMGLLYQWATARHWDRGIRDAGFKSQRAFAKRFRLSEDRLNNMISGRRIARFEDYAALSFIVSDRLKRDPLPSSTTLRRAVREAVRRSKAESEHARSAAAVRLLAVPSVDLARDFELAREVLLRTLLAHPDVHSHLSATAKRSGAMEVEVLAAPGTRATGSGFVRARGITGRIHVPNGWRNDVYRRWRGQVDGYFIASIDGPHAQGALCTAIRVVSTEDGPVKGDVTFSAQRAVITRGDERIVWLNSDG